MTPDTMTLDEYRAWQAEQKPARQPREDREHQEQAALFAWAALHEGRHPELALLFAIPNGGDRHPAVAAKLRAEGTKAGVWDILLPVARNGRPGLWIEMKFGDNGLTPAQKAWGARMREQGYVTAVCYTWTAAVRAVAGYLDIEETGL